ncbi:MAG: hypothetical protein HZA92_11140 [Verrucomicrobia bacterium]|nr:hypothetical protein [Verrucomicrobiota bacterium]
MPTKRAAVADVHAPSVALPLQFILTGIAALLAASVWLVVRPIILAGYHYSPEVLAATHLFVLGWICSVIMGAMYQLVPVALETRLHSQRLARWHFALHVTGFIGMVVMFHREDMKQVGHFGSLVAIGVGLFVHNLARTLARIPRWNVVAAGIASSLCWLSLSILAGLYLAAAKCWSFSQFAPLAQLHAHAHLGGLGFFVMMIVSVSFKLVPMFTLGEVQSVRRAGWSLALLNAGLAGAFVTVLLSSPWKIIFALVVAAGLAFYGLEIISILRARKRSRLDWGVKYFLTALVLLAPVLVLGVVLAWPGLPANELTLQLETTYGFLALAGVVTFAILGMLYKVVPFLVWYASYSKAIGQSKIPALADLYSHPLQAAGYWLFLGGLLTASAASALGHDSCVRAGCVALLASFVVFAVNIGMVLSHLVRPRIEPLIAHSALQTNTRPLP